MAPTQRSGRLNLNEHQLIEQLRRHSMLVREQLRLERLNKVRRSSVEKLRRGLRPENIRRFHRDSVARIRTGLTRENLSRLRRRSVARVRGARENLNRENFQRVRNHSVKRIREGASTAKVRIDSGAQKTRAVTFDLSQRTLKATRKSLAETQLPPRVHKHLHKVPLPSKVEEKVPGGRVGICCILLVLLLVLFLVFLIVVVCLVNRPAFTTHSLLVITGGFGTESRVELFSAFYEEESRNLSDLPLPDGGRHGHAALTFADGAYLLAGGSGSQGDTLRTTDFLFLTNSTITRGPPMLEKRHLGAGAVLDGVAYVCGGERREKRRELDSCERMSRERFGWRWTLVAPMLRRRSGAAAVALGGLLYVIGGRDQHNVELSAVERYNPRYDAWSSVAPMREGREGAAAVVWDGRILVCGGYYAGWDLASCEAYDPDSNTWTKLVMTLVKFWVLEMPSMTSERRYFGLASIGDDVLAVGGMYQDTCEYYNPYTAQWSLSPLTLLSRAWMPAFALREHP